MNRISDALRARGDDLRRDDEGFTLIEVLVVILIIGILTAIAVPVYLGLQSNAKESAVRTDLANLKTAETAHYTQKDSYVAGSGSALSVTALANRGYSQSDVANYRATTTTPKFYASTATTGGFCIMAIASTNTSFAVSESVSLSKGSCTSAGAYSGAQVTALP